MTQNAQSVKEHEINVREQENQVRQARCALAQGYKKLQAQMEQEYDELKHKLEREESRETRLVFRRPRPRLLSRQTRATSPQRVRLRPQNLLRPVAVRHF